MSDEPSPTDGLMNTVSPTFKLYADALKPWLGRLGDGVSYERGGYMPPAATLLRNDTGEDLPFDQDHRLTEVRKVRLEAGEYIIPTHLIPLIKRAE